MNILINASNLKVGGGLQVADSIINELFSYTNHNFVVVVSKSLGYLEGKIGKTGNMQCLVYDMPQTVGGVLFGRNKYLDKIVKKNNIRVVYTVFGPSLWRPKVRHLCGFARAQMIYLDSPYYLNMGLLKKLKLFIREIIRFYNFKMSSDWLITESSNVSKRLALLMKNKRIYTVTNNYNQIYNHSHKWIKHSIEPYDGITCLTISANYPHKNLGIIPQILEYIDSNKIPLNIRFIITLSEKEFVIDKVYQSRILLIGKVYIEECPSLFQQADYMFLPTLLECFSASYPEAMKMETPIITSDLPFAHSLCGDAAVYVDSLSPKSIVDALLSLTEDKRKELINKGKEQLKKYDTAEERCRKVIELLEKINKQ